MILELCCVRDATYIKRLAFVVHERRVSCPSCGLAMAIRWQVYPKRETPPDSVSCPNCNCPVNTKENP